MRAFLVVQSEGDILRAGNYCAASSCLEEFKSCFDLWSHATRRKFTLLQVSLGVRPRIAS